MGKIKYYILTLGIIAGFGLAVMPSSVGAQTGTAISEACKAAPESALCKNKSPSAQVFIKNLVDSLLYVLAAVSVIVIIFAGIFYSTSNGDAALITKAKNTLMYAVIGLIVAIMAYSIVHFVVDRFA